MRVSFLNNGFAWKQKAQEKLQTLLGSIYIVNGVFNGNKSINGFRNRDSINWIAALRINLKLVWIHLCFYFRAFGDILNL